MLVKIISAIKNKAFKTLPAGEVRAQGTPNILSLINASHAALKRHEDEINRLNVFPVPDGDTGTNMALTVQNVLAEAVKAGDGSREELLKAIVYGSLMGARGNSGVILSQMIRGICEQVEKSGDLSTKTIVSALKSGSDTAYQAVKKPAEGTMLTVMRDMAIAAADLPAKATSVDVLECIIQEGKKSVERTPMFLPVLKEAGVVDAGGYGLVVIAQGMLAALKGQPIDGSGAVSEDIAAMNIVEDSFDYTYCTEFILKGSGISTASLEAKLDHLGDSVLVVGTPELTKIHIHTNEPGKVLQIATDLGTINNVQINNMVEQTEKRNQALLEEQESQPEAPVGIVAVASGEGIAEILKSMGVDKVVSGGQSMNPSTADILAAVDSIPAKNVIILPNNKNIILAAQQVADLTHKTISVIPTKAIPEAFAALMVFNKAAPFEQNVEEMSEAFYEVKTGEVTFAVRDDNKGGFKENDIIGLYDREIKTSGKHLLSTTLNLIEHMLDDSDECLTILVGEHVSEDEATELTEVLNDRHPELEIDIHRGNQPVYHFIIGIE